jgi:hypothetical protein
MFHYFSMIPDGQYPVCQSSVPFYGIRLWLSTIINDFWSGAACNKQSQFYLLTQVGSLTKMEAPATNGNGTAEPLSPDAEVT